MKNKNFVYTDGACSGNPGPGGWAIAAYFQASGQVIEKGAADPATTNNRMELLAAIEALSLALAKDPDADLVIFSDSKLVIEGARSWIHGWKKKNWIKSDGKPVMNQDLWQRLYPLLLSYGRKLQWHYVAGHSEICGNDRVDEIAVAYSKLSHIDLYHGSLAAYPHEKAFEQSELRTLTQEADPSEKKSKTRSAPATKDSIYLSYVDRELLRHKSWAECEARVKGRSGAKFKRVQNSSEEAQVLASWGLPPKKT